MQRNSPMPYQPPVDGLRAIAVLSVVAFHSFPGEITGGFVGVDVFFVISGFLISGIILNCLLHGSFTFAQFSPRPVKHNFPMYIGGCAAISWLGCLFIFLSRIYRTVKLI